MAYPRIYEIRPGIGNLKVKSMFSLRGYRFYQHLSYDLQEDISDLTVVDMRYLIYHKVILVWIEITSCEL